MFNFPYMLMTASHDIIGSTVRFRHLFPLLYKFINITKLTKLIIRKHGEWIHCFQAHSSLKRKQHILAMKHCTDFTTLLHVITNYA